MYLCKKYERPELLLMAQGNTYLNTKPDHRTETGLWRQHSGSTWLTARGWGDMGNWFEYHTWLASTRSAIACSLANSTWPCFIFFNKYMIVFASTQLCHGIVAFPIAKGIIPLGRKFLFSNSRRKRTVKWSGLKRFNERILFQPNIRG